MVPEFIVPDCLGFYLLSLFPLAEDATKAERDAHMGCIQLVVNEVMQLQVFDNEFVTAARRQMRDNGLSFEQLLNH